VHIPKNSPRPGRRSPYFYEESSLPGRHSFQDRWNDVRAIADLRLTDRVLDVGCAEGLIALEVAKTVDSVRGFDVSRDRVAEANRMAAERGTRNAIFEVASVDDYSLKPLSYDVVLFLALWGKNLRNGKAIGAEHLDRLLAATRRQMIMRVAIQNEPHREGTLEQILTICEEREFDALCFSSTRPKNKKEGPWLSNIIVANRRGTDARVGKLPRLALIPTALLADHPIVAPASMVGRVGSTNDR
jgi:SAM-dependent methyltransferase